MRIPSFAALILAPAAVPAVPDVEQNAALLVDAIIQIESNGDAQKVGRHGERGLMQIKSGTWRDMTTRLFGAPISFDQAFDPALNRRVGTAYLASEPGAKAFVEVGDMIREGQTVMIIEAMKHLNQIPAPRAGKVTAVLVENGQPVEFGEPLLIIE